MYYALHALAAAATGEAGRGGRSPAQRYCSTPGSARLYQCPRPPEVTDAELACPAVAQVLPRFYDERSLVVTVNDLLDGQVAVDIECLDRVYLSEFVNGLQTPGGVITPFTITGHADRLPRRSSPGSGITLWAAGRNATSLSSGPGPVTHRRLLHAERAGQGCVLANPGFEQIAHPSLTTDGRRATAVRSATHRVQALAGAPCTSPPPAA
jgi:hypothetical protein